MHTYIQHYISQECIYFRLVFFKELLDYHMKHPQNINIYVYLYYTESYI